MPNVPQVSVTSPARRLKGWPGAYGPDTWRGLGAVNSTRSTAWPPGRTTVVMLAGRYLAFTALR